MNKADDEDWLYRRGSHADAPSTVGDDPEATRYGVPTPVGHYVPRPADAPPAAPRSTEQPPAPSATASTPPPAGSGWTVPTPVPAPTAPAAGRRRRRPVRRWGGRAVGVLLAYLVGIPLVLWPFVPRVDAAPDGQRPAGQMGQVFVLAGSDSRAGLTPEEQERLGTGSDAGQRTDTIMLLYAPVGGKAALISVPRDSFVAVPGHGKNKINAAYALGGPALLVRTVEANTGLRVAGYAEIGFGGFVNAVDAVGGIEMCPPAAIRDRDSNLDIPAGCQQMDGVTALGYVRMRKADPRGDLGRAERQREMLGALARKTLSPATVVLPWRWWGLNWSLSRAITVGHEVGPLELAGLAGAAVRIGTGQGLTLSVPVGDADAQTPAGSSVLWDERASAALFTAMRAGAPVDEFAG